MEVNDKQIKGIFFLEDFSFEFPIIGPKVAPLRASCLTKSYIGKT